MGGLGTVALALLVGVLGKLLADEFKAWSPALVKSLLALAVRMMPPQRRERCAEEWQSHADDLPGDLAKVGFACGCMLASGNISRLHVRIGKRTADLITAVVSLLLLAPFLVPVIVALAFTSRDSVLFRQRRIGRKGKEFTLYKFRTLRQDKSPTAVGKILRDLKIDEVPQLLNVLSGDMTIIGPRALADDSRPDVAERPGVTRSLREIAAIARSDVQAIFGFFRKLLGRK